MNQNYANGQPAQRLRTVLNQPGLLTMPCCYDVLTSRLIHEAGFPLTPMSGFAVAAPLYHADINTDTIIPMRWLVTAQRSGLGKGLFSEWRYRPDGSEDAAFVLNQVPYRGAHFDPRAELRLRQLARTGAVGVARFRHTLHCRAGLRQHFF